MTGPGAGDVFYRMNGAGEMLTFSAADFEDFLEPRPELPATLEAELHAVVGHLLANRWPFRLHATYDESTSRFLLVPRVLSVLARWRRPREDSTLPAERLYRGFRSRL